ncbi:MAG: hypothetical protein R3C68_02050 [Myxococcota bacterium]
MNISWSTLLVTHPHDPAVLPAWVNVVMLIGAAALLTAGWSLAQLKHLRRTLADLKNQVSGLTEERKQLVTNERLQNKDLEERRAESQKIKKDLATQRKKTHDAQEEAKKLRNDLREQQQRFEKIRSERPAFAEPVAKHEREVEAPSVPAPIESAPAKSADITDPAVKILEARVNELETDRQSLQNDFKKEQEHRRNQSEELKRIRRKLEDYRRIDTLTRGKTELLEDRLAHLGKQYYDAVSEVALLKGEVPDISKLRTIQSPPSSQPDPTEQTLTPPTPVQVPQKQQKKQKKKKESNQDEADSDVIAIKHDDEPGVTRMAACAGDRSF